MVTPVAEAADVRRVRYWIDTVGARLSPLAPAFKSLVFLVR